MWPREGHFVEEDHGFATPCQIWQGAILHNGYGQTSLDGVVLNAHRASYINKHGSIPDGAVIDHLCGTRACINPTHLEAVTQAENVRRSPLARLTQTDVEQIRERLQSGEPQRSIGKAFGVSQSAISLINLGKRWSTPGGVLT